MARKKRTTAEAPASTGHTGIEIETAAVDDVDDVAAPEAAEDVLPVDVARIAPAAVDSVELRFSLTPPQRFAVPYGGRYAIDGFIQELAPGSVVSAATHPMAAILEAKIEICPV
jgi:hypothetical protein